MSLWTGRWRDTHSGNGDSSPCQLPSLSDAVYLNVNVGLVTCMLVSGTHRGSDRPLDRPQRVE